MEQPRTPVEAFLAEHGQTQRDAAAGASLGLAQVNALVGGKVDPRNSTVRRFIAYCRTLDPDVTYERLFGAIPAEESANGAEQAVEPPEPASVSCPHCEAP